MTPSAERDGWLAWVPPAWLSGVILMIGLMGRCSANEVEAAARAEVARQAAAVELAAQHARDSSAFGALVDTAKPRTRAEFLALDMQVHGTGFDIPHSALHSAATVARLDSSSSLLRRAAGSAVLLVAARALLAAPVEGTGVDAERHARLEAQASRIAATQAAAQKRSQDLEAKRLARASAPRALRAAPTAPSGASARCRDGSYSYSASRRGTCSHHGGVAAWL